GAQAAGERQRVGGPRAAERRGGEPLAARLVEGIERSRKRRRLVGGEVVERLIAERAESVGARRQRVAVEPRLQVELHRQRLVAAGEEVRLVDRLPGPSGVARIEIAVAAEVERADAGRAVGELRG